MHIASQPQISEPPAAVASHRRLPPQSGSTSTPADEAGGGANPITQSALAVCRHFPSWTDLTLRQLALLELVAIRPGIEPTAAAAAMRVTKSIISRACRALSPYIERRADEHDGRKIHLHLTTGGVLLHHALHSVVA